MDLELKTDTQMKRETEALEKVAEEIKEAETHTNVGSGHLLLRLIDGDFNDPIDAKLVITLGPYVHKAKHVDSGVMEHTASKPLFGHIMKWMDPPENAHVHVKLLRHRFLLGDVTVGEADAVVNLKDCMTSWKAFPIKIGAIGTLNAKVYFHPAGSTAIDDTIPNLEPEKSSILTDEDSLWYLARDIDDPTGKEKKDEEAGEPIHAITTEVSELRHHMVTIVDFLTHIKHLVMWRDSVSEGLFICFSLVFFSYYNMVLSGICVALAAAFLWSFVRYSIGLPAWEEKIEIKSDSDKTELLNRARRGTRSLRKVNEMMTMFQRYITVDSSKRFATASIWLLGCAFITAIIPVRFFVMLGGIYLFTVQSVYMNFPNIKRQYYWPAIVREYFLKAKQSMENVQVITATRDFINQRQQQNPLHPKPLEKPHSATPVEGNKLAALPVEQPAVDAGVAAYPVVSDVQSAAITAIDHSGPVDAGLATTTTTYTEVTSPAMTVVSDVAPIHYDQPSYVTGELASSPIQPVPIQNTAFFNENVPAEVRSTTTSSAIVAPGINTMSEGEGLRPLADISTPEQIAEGLTRTVLVPTGPPQIVMMPASQAPKEAVLVSMPAPTATGTTESGFQPYAPKTNSASDLLQERSEATRLTGA